MGFIKIQQFVYFSNILNDYLKLINEEKKIIKRKELIIFFGNRHQMTPKL